jgi:hypothetical protein
MLNRFRAGLNRVEYLLKIAVLTVAWTLGPPAVVIGLIVGLGFGIHVGWNLL